jgi:hypothetical protein
MKKKNEGAKKSGCKECGGKGCKECGGKGCKACKPAGAKKSTKKC